MYVCVYIYIYIYNTSNLAVGLFLAEFGPWGTFEKTGCRIFSLGSRAKQRRMQSCFVQRNMEL